MRFNRLAWFSLLQSDPIKSCKRLPQKACATSPRIPPSDSAMMSFCETVRWGKNIWINSIEQASAANVTISKNRMTPRGFEFCLDHKICPHNMLSGINNRRLATQSAREPIPRSRKGISLNFVKAWSNGIGTNRSGTKLPYITNTR